MSATLSDTEFESVKSRLNAALHELVFATKHADDDQLEEALNCLCIAGLTIETVSMELAGILQKTEGGAP